MCVMLPWGWNVKWLGLREMSGGTWPREAINVELIHWDIKFKWKPLTSCNPRMKKAWRYLRPETMPFQHSETCLNFLSPSFSSHNAPPWLGRLTCGKMKKKKSVLIWFVQENWREIEMIPQSCLWHYRYISVELLECRKTKQKTTHRDLSWVVLDTGSGYCNT